MSEKLDWTGQTVVIVAAGPSCSAIDLTRAMGYAKVLVINESWNLAPWADAMYACDYAWWKHRDGCPGFHGVKFSADQQAVDEYPDIRHVELWREVNTIITEEKNVIGDGRNSGFQALNLAVLLGSKDIVLVGYDMTLEYGVHWHGWHDRPLNNPQEHNVLVWRKHLDAVAPLLAKKGVRVRNASHVSRLEAYPKVNFYEIF